MSIFRSRCIWAIAVGLSLCVLHVTCSSSLLAWSTQIPHSLGNTTAHLLEAETGARHQNGASSILQQPTAGFQNIYTVDSDGGIYAVDLESGVHVWKARSPASIWSGVSVYVPTAKTGIGTGNVSRREDLELVIVVSNWGIQAFKGSNGDEVWSFQLGQVVTSPLVIDKQAQVIAVSFDGVIVSLDADSGVEQWRVEIESGASTAPFAPPDSLFFYVLTADKLTRAELATGFVTWERDIEDSTPSSRIMQWAVLKSLIIVTLSGHVDALCEQSGALSWSMSHTSASPAALAIVAGMLYIIAPSGVLYILDANGHITQQRKWTTRPPRTMNNIVHLVAQPQVCDATVAEKPTIATTHPSRKLLTTRRLGGNMGTRIQRKILGVQASRVLQNASSVPVVEDGGGYIEEHSVLPPEPKWNEVALSAVRMWEFDSVLASDRDGSVMDLVSSIALTEEGVAQLGVTWQVASRVRVRNGTLFLLGANRTLTSWPTLGCGMRMDGAGNHVGSEGTMQTLRAGASVSEEEAPEPAPPPRVIHLSKWAAGVLAGVICLMVATGGIACIFYLRLPAEQRRFGTLTREASPALPLVSVQTAVQSVLPMSMHATGCNSWYVEAADVTDTHDAWAGPPHTFSSSNTHEVHSGISMHIASKAKLTDSFCALALETPSLSTSIPRSLSAPDASLPMNPYYAPPPFHRSISQPQAQNTYTAPPTQIQSSSSWLTPTSALTHPTSSFPSSFSSHRLFRTNSLKSKNTSTVSDTDTPRGYSPPPSSMQCMPPWTRMVSLFSSARPSSDRPRRPLHTPGFTDSTTNMSTDYATDYSTNVHENPVFLGAEDALIGEEVFQDAISVALNPTISTLSEDSSYFTPTFILTPPLPLFCDDDLRLCMSPPQLGSRSQAWGAAPQRLLNRPIDRGTILQYSGLASICDSEALPSLMYDARPSFSALTSNNSISSCLITPPRRGRPPRRSCHPSPPQASPAQASPLPAPPPPLCTPFHLQCPHVPGITTRPTATVSLHQCSPSCPCRHPPSCSRNTIHSRIRKRSRSL